MSARHHFDHRLMTAANATLFVADTIQSYGYTSVERWSLYIWGIGVTLMQHCTTACIASIATIIMLLLNKQNLLVNTLTDAFDKMYCRSRTGALEFCRPKLYYKVITEWLRCQPDDEDKWEWMKCLVEQMRQNDHNGKTHEWIGQLVKEKLVCDTKAHRDEMLAIVLNAFLDNSPVFPIDPIQYDEFLRKTDPKMLNMDYNFDAVQTVNTILHMYKTCQHLIKKPHTRQSMEAAIRADDDDVSELSVEGGIRRNRPRRNLECNKDECNKLRKQLEHCVHVTTYFALKLHIQKVKYTNTHGP